MISDINGSAYVSVLKAVVTQASSAIPIMPLFSLLFKVMKARGTNEDCIEQVAGLFHDSLYSDSPYLDEAQRLRADLKEIDPKTQQEVIDLWPQVTNDNIDELTDFVGYQSAFLKLFGFGLDNVDYEQEVNPQVNFAGLVE